MLRQYVPLAEFSLAPYASSTLAHPAPNPVTPAGTASFR